MYNLKSIMRKAWEIKKEDSQNLFSLCLKMAWAEEKNGKEDEKVKRTIIVKTNSTFFESDLKKAAEADDVLSKCIKEIIKKHIFQFENDFGNNDYHCSVSVVENEFNDTIFTIDLFDNELTKIGEKLIRDFNGKYWYRNGKRRIYINDLSNYNKKLDYSCKIFYDLNDKEFHYSYCKDEMKPFLVETAKMIKNKVSN